MNLQRLTKNECAELLCVDVRSVTNYLEKGIPKHRAKNELFFVWSEVFAWREQMIRDDVRATRKAAGNEDAKNEAAELKLRQMRVETENAEINLYERRRHLVTIGFMRKELQRIGEVLRTRLITLPGDLAARLGGCNSFAERKIALQDAINELMPLLSADVNEDATQASALAVQ